MTENRVIFSMLDIFTCHQDMLHAAVSAILQVVTLQCRGDAALSDPLSSVSAFHTFNHITALRPHKHPDI